MWGIVKQRHIQVTGKTPTIYVMIGRWVKGMQEIIDELDYAILALSSDLLGDHENGVVVMQRRLKEVRDLVEKRMREEQEMRRILGEK